jgi:hypothetical protein
MFQWRKRTAWAFTGALILVCLGFVYVNYYPSASVADDAPAVPDRLPSQLSSAEFWGLIESFSEPNGYFRSDNFLSNESGLQDVIPNLSERVKTGGVYIGVGPEQNFTYLVAFQPKISFIVDIRRLNMLEHLLYKAIFELSRDRGDFVSFLFSRPRPKGITEKTKVADLFSAFEKVEEDQTLLERNLNAILMHLTGFHRLTLSEEDQGQIRYILSNFSQAGPGLSYSFLGSYYQGTLGMPTYVELMEATDGQGHNWSFLATEEQFREIQELQRKNLIIPLVGDFAGPKTIRAIGRYLAQHDAVVSLFYTSNVEMYLFQQGDDWMKFYENVSTLPLNSNSSFIRFAAGWGRRFGSGPNIFSGRSQMWSPILDVIDSANSGKLEDYAGVLSMSK